LQPFPSQQEKSMTLSDIIDARAVLANVKAQSKKQLLLDLSDAMARVTGLEPRAIFATLNTREKLGSTGLGQGIAIPHGRVAGINRVHGLLAHLAQPLAFDSIDGAPVDLVFVLLAPQHEGADHLTALARISRLLRDASLVEKLRGTQSSEALYAIVTEPEQTQHAA
jgi:nitrogen PTS system EIIA component